MNPELRTTSGMDPLSLNKQRIAELAAQMFGGLEPFPPLKLKKEKEENPETGGHESQLDVNNIRKDFPALHQKINGKPLIWLDNAATTQKPKAVIDAISNFYERDNSNINRSSHTLAGRAQDAYEDARSKVQKFIGAQSDKEIIFVRGTTEGINLIAKSYGQKNIKEGDEILLTTLEHHSNIVPWFMLAQEKKALLKVVPLNDRGEVMLEEYSRLMGPKTKIAAFGQVSNVLGTVVPVKQMTEIAHQNNVPVLIDGAQAVAHKPVNVQDMDCDFFVLSGHKLLGPTGIGAVYAKKERLKLMPPRQGGGSMIQNVRFDEVTYKAPPDKFEAGTPSIADAVGLGAAIDYINRIGIEKIEAYEKALTVYATEQLSKVPGLTQIGTSADKTSILSFVIKDISPEETSRKLDKEGIAVRAGHHCAQPVHERFGQKSTVRASIALYNTRKEIDTLVKTLKSLRQI